MYIRNGVILLLIAVLCSCKYSSTIADKRNRANWSALTLAELLQIAEENPQQDSLTYYVRKAVDKQHLIYVRSRKFKEGLSYLDSIEKNRYIAANCQYELLSAKAGLNQMLGNNSKAIEYANAYNKLPENDDKNIFIRQAEIISGVFMYCSNDVDKAIRVLEKAVDVYHDGGEYSHIIRIMSRLGSYYRFTGEYEKALETNHRAIDLYNDGMPAENVVIVYGEQSNLYVELGLYEKALEMSRMAEYYSVKSNNYGLGDIYRYRSELFQKMSSAENGFSDSVFYYLHIAGNVSASQKSFKGVFVNNLQLADAYLQYPDSLTKALDLLQSIGADTIRMPQWVSYQFKLQYGKALQQKGEVKRGIAFIEEAADGFALMNMVEMEYETNKYLMSYYLNTGDNVKFNYYYARNQIFADSLNSNEKMRAVAASNIRFETEKREKENKILTAKVEMQEQQLYCNIAIIIVLILLFIGVIGYFIIRRRVSRSEIKAGKQKIEQLLANQQALHSKNEQLIEQIEQAAATNNINKIRTLACQTLLSREDELHFRQSFAKMYPSYLPSLRESYPRLTRTEELLAMLICLNQSTDEIAIIMGINRNSVNMMRSRMRKNLNLTKEQPLDDLLRSYLN